MPQHPPSRQPTPAEIILNNQRRLRAELAPLIKATQTVLSPDQPPATDLMLDLLTQILAAIEQLRADLEGKVLDETTIASAIRRGSKT